MNPTITIPEQEVFDFIAAQPDDRNLNFRENYVTHEDDCGCLLIQFARSKGFKGELDCGWDAIHTEKETVAFSGEGEIRKLIWQIINMEHPSRPANYKELKAMLSK